MARKISTRLALLYIVFVAMTVAGIVSTASGIILWLSSNGGGYRGDGSRGGYRDDQTMENRGPVLGLARSSWKYVHAISSIACVILVIVHVILNWKWILSASRAIFR